MHGGGGGGLAGVGAGVTVLRLQMSTQVCAHCEERRTWHVVNRIVARSELGRARLSTMPRQNGVAKSAPHLGPQLLRQSASMSAVTGAAMDSSRTSATETATTSSAILGVVAVLAEAIGDELE